MINSYTFAIFFFDYKTHDLPFNYAVKVGANINLFTRQQKRSFSLLCRSHIFAMNDSN
jgi:hypothetical protein